MSLNSRAQAVVAALSARAEELKIAHETIEGGGRVIDCGIAVRGGLLAGIGVQ